AFALSLNRKEHTRRLLLRQKCKRLVIIFTHHQQKYLVKFSRDSNSSKSKAERLIVKCFEQTAFALSLNRKEETQEDSRLGSFWTK
ncbi:unnamed protein product, partial [Larinioides sclopetarius]